MNSFTDLTHLFNTTSLAIIGAAILIIIFGAGFLLRRRTKKLDVAKFQGRWQELQRFCVNDETWPLAIIDADKLLDEALKCSGFRGRTMGERLVAAQRSLSDNDGVWYGHKLRNKVVHEETRALQKRDVQAALRGFRTALKDLGALR